MMYRAHAASVPFTGIPHFHVLGDPVTDSGNGRSFFLFSPMRCRHRHGLGVLGQCTNRVSDAYEYKAYLSAQPRDILSRSLFQVNLLLSCKPIANGTITISLPNALSYTRLAYAGFHVERTDIFGEYSILFQSHFHSFNAALCDAASAGASATDLKTIEKFSW